MLEKRPNNVCFWAFFDQFNFSVDCGRFKDDFGKFLGDGRNLDTVSEHRIDKFEKKLGVTE